MNRNMSSFAMQDCESNNKVKKKPLVSMQSFTHRPVGNSKNPGPLWRNKNGFLIHKSRISQLFYPHWLGRIRPPYKCSVCENYGHNSSSSVCLHPTDELENTAEDDLEVFIDDQHMHDVLIDGQYVQAHFDAPILPHILEI